jgi:hypothetical protein
MNGVISVALLTFFERRGSSLLIDLYMAEAALLVIGCFQPVQQNFLFIERAVAFGAFPYRIALRPYVFLSLIIFMVTLDASHLIFFKVFPVAESYWLFLFFLISLIVDENLKG